MAVPTISVDQSLSPENRIRLSEQQRSEARQLVDVYLADMDSALDVPASFISEYTADWIGDEYRDELNSLAKLLDIDFESVLVSNLYYDLFKMVMGCTAFAVDSLDGPILARNLDWWTKNRILADFTVIVDYLAGDDRLPFKAVAWPGYTGVLSGVAPGRFAVALNAVLSAEPSGDSRSISYLIRETLATADDYEAAVQILATADIVPDCLLLVAGVKSGEMCVIERTPTRSAIRLPRDGFIAVSNDYKLMPNYTDNSGSELQATSRGRLDRVSKLVLDTRFFDSSTCFEILKDQYVAMGITVQHITMSAKTGKLAVDIPLATCS